MSERKSGGSSAAKPKIDIYEVWDELRQTVKNQRLSKASEEAKAKHTQKRLNNPKEDLEILTLSSRERNLEEEIRALDTRLRNSRYKLAVAESKIPKASQVSQPKHAPTHVLAKTSVQITKVAEKTNPQNMRNSIVKPPKTESNESLGARQHSKLFWHEIRCKSREVPRARKPSGDWSKTISITADFDGSFTKKSKIALHHHNSTGPISTKGNLPYLDPKAEEDYVQRIVTREFGNLSVFDLYAMGERPELWIRYKQTVLGNQSVYSAQDGDPSEQEIPDEPFDELAKIQTDSPLQSYHAQPDGEAGSYHDSRQQQHPTPSSKNNKIYY